MQKGCILLSRLWYPPEFYVIVGSVSHVFFSKLLSAIVLHPFACKSTPQLGARPLIITECGISDCDDTRHAL